MRFRFTAARHHHSDCPAQLLARVTRDDLTILAPPLSGYDWQTRIAGQ
jgi:hypothetical protein